MVLRMLLPSKPGNNSFSMACGNVWPQFRQVCCRTRNICIDNGFGFDANLLLYYDCLGDNDDEAAPFLTSSAKWLFICCTNHPMFFYTHEVMAYQSCECHITSGNCFQTLTRTIENNTSSSYRIVIMQTNIRFYGIGWIFWELKLCFDIHTLSFRR